MTLSSGSAPRALGVFQDRFADALFAPRLAASVSPQLARIVAQPGFAVYRNTVMRGCIDALQANYPAVSRLVGDERFRAAAAVYVRTCPPQQPSLVDYGDGFADFLATFDGTGDLLWLAGVARLDRFWTESHIAPDEPPVAAAALAQLTPAQLGGVVLRTHAAARWAWFDEHPVTTIWARKRMEDGGEGDHSTAMAEIRCPGEGVLITRPRGVVEWKQISKSDCAFLDACASGGTLADAAVAALDVDAHADLAGTMARTLAAGALAHLALQP